MWISQTHWLLNWGIIRFKILLILQLSPTQLFMWTNCSFCVGHNAGYPWRARRCLSTKIRTGWGSKLCWEKYPWEEVGWNLTTLMRDFRRARKGFQSRKHNHPQLENSFHMVNHCSFCKWSHFAKKWIHSATHSNCMILYFFPDVQEPMSKCEHANYNS